MPSGPALVNVFEHDHPGLHRDAEERQHADARGYAQVSSGNQERQQTAEGGQGDVDQNEHRPFEGAKHGVENDEDDKDRQRDDDSQPRLSPLLTLLFARPLDAVARRHLHLFIDPLDGVFDRGTQVPASHAESYYLVAGVAFPVDVVRAILDLDFTKLRQRHPLSRWGNQANLLDGLRGIAIGRLVAHHHVVPLLANQHLTYRVAAHRRLDGVLYVRHVDSKTGGSAAVNR